MRHKRKVSNVDFAVMCAGSCQKKLIQEWKEEGEKKLNHLNKVMKHLKDSNKIKSSPPLQDY